MVIVELSFIIFPFCRFFFSSSYPGEVLSGPLDFKKTVVTTSLWCMCVCPSGRRPCMHGSVRPSVWPEFSRTYVFMDGFEISLAGMFSLTHSHTMTPFDAPEKQAFWKHCGKRRNCSIRAISPFPTVFSTCLDNFLPFSSNLKLSSADSFQFGSLKFVVW